MPKTKRAAVVIRPADVAAEAEPANALVGKRLVRGDTHGPDISVTWISIDGRHKRLVSRQSDRVYYIVSGAGRFELGDAAPVAVAAGEIVFIPRDVDYALEGRMTYLVMNGPAFRPGADEYLE